ncbi:RING finger protein 207-like [Saccostrea echinata]|uniref:RING finger protein 207-like n=1 Tax=Saccostrea echinata TaxID=191078 RepID=UPI002A7F4835|nr:RING finger protein 207-like [Saccostrea echinata]
MASSVEYEFLDSFKCPICFENFKTPRYLPCYHSFCHDCLSKHILSLCERKEVKPLGFHCPLCRDFIPAVEPSEDLSKWAIRFPLNMLKSCENTVYPRLCDACKRENEEEDAVEFCLECRENLCRICSKYHHRILLTKKHKLVPLGELKLFHLLSSESDKCQMHSGKKVKMYCRDHDVLCCTHCIFMKHRSCEEIDTIKQTADRLQSNGHFESLLTGIKDLKLQLSETKNTYERNISEINDNAEEITGKVETLHKNMESHLRKLKEDFLDHLSTKTKTYKEELQRKTESLNNSIKFLNHCTKTIDGVLDSEDNVMKIREFQNIQNKYGTFKTANATENLEWIGLTSSINSDIMTINNCSKFGDIYFTRSNANSSTVIDNPCMDLVSFDRKPRVRVRVRMMKYQNQLATKQKLRRKKMK